MQETTSICDYYPSMTALYADEINIEGTTYGKRWLRREWSQTTEAQSNDNPETKKIVTAVHGGGIEGGTSEIALAVAGYHPATLEPAADALGRHDFWMFEGLLSLGNTRLHVTSTNYNEPIALKLVRNAQRCLSLHGCSDDDAKGNLQIGGRDIELKEIILEELTSVQISAEISTNSALDGLNPDNICNKTESGSGAQIEMGTSYRESLFEAGCNTRALRKTHTNAEFWKLVGALRNALNRLEVSPD